MTLPSQALLTELLSYDHATGQLRWQNRPRSMFKRDQDWKRWNNRYGGCLAFTATNKYGYLVGAVNDKVYRAHRIIWKMVHGTEPNQIDHQDGNRTNNRLTNLRDVTGQENQMNMKRSRANLSGVTGVCWDKSKQRWKATIGVDGRTVNLGRFHTKEEAINARKNAEAQYGFHSNHGR